MLCLIGLFGKIEESVSWITYRAFRADPALPLLIGILALLFLHHLLTMPPPPRFPLGVP